jgi:hypothetical protein
MAMTITVIIMGNTKATTRTSRAIGIGILGAVLAVSAAVNLFGTLTPAATLNARISARLLASAALPENLKPIEFALLKQIQEQALAAKPPEPFGWARLSYLRTKTGSSDADAFAALRMSDTVSPFETQQLPERAVTWGRFKSVQTPAEQDYQDTLWQKAFTLATDETWDFAVHLGITPEVGRALARKNSDLASGWYGRMSDAGIAAN